MVLWTREIRQMWRGRRKGGKREEGPKDNNSCHGWKHLGVVKRGEEKLLAANLPKTRCWGPHQWRC